MVQFPLKLPLKQRILAVFHDFLWKLTQIDSSLEGPSLWLFYWACWLACVVSTRALGGTG